MKRKQSGVRLAQSVRKVSSLRRRQNTLPDAPHHSVNAALAFLDLDGFRLRVPRFRARYLEHPVLEVGRHPAPISIFRKCEAAHEAPVRAFGPMIFFAFFFFLECPFSGNRQDIVLHRKLHVLFLHVRQLGIDEVLLLILYSVHQGRPLGNRQGFLPPIPGRPPSSQHRRQPAFQFIPILERIPSSSADRAPT